MNRLPPVYPLKSVEQLRAIADELRQRILQALAARPMTVTQVGELLGEAPAKIFYHVRELQRVELVQLVDTRERGGILEKYYRTVAEAFHVPPSLLEHLPPGERAETAQTIVEDVMRSLTYALHVPDAEWDEYKRLSLARSYAWMTDDEVHQVLSAMDDLLAPYRVPRKLEGEHERAFITVEYDPHLVEDAGDEPAAVREGTSRSRSFVLGLVRYTREDLEAAVRRGQALDIVIYGSASFAHDITPDLIDRAVYRFRHRGPLEAEAPVKAALARKESLPNQDV